MLPLDTGHTEAFYFPYIREGCAKEEPEKPEKVNCVFQMVKTVKYLNVERPTVRPVKRNIFSARGQESHFLQRR